MWTTAAKRAAKYTAIAAVAAIGGTKAAFVMKPDWERRFHAALFARDLRAYNEAVSKLKFGHFAPLRSLRSHDPILRRQGKIRIVEVGAGPGVNVQFYPMNAIVTAVDPQPEFKRNFEEEVKRNGRELESYIVGEGENLSSIPDSSVDAVVTTMVMCHLHDPPKFLEEVKRILAPKGQYYFWEHVEGFKPEWEPLIVDPLDPPAQEELVAGIHKHEEEPFLYYLRFLMELIFDWKIHSRGGKIMPGQQTPEERLIRDAGFEQVEVDFFDLNLVPDEELAKMSFFARRLVKFMREHGHLRGVAVKGDPAAGGGVKKNGSKTRIFKC